MRDLAWEANLARYPPRPWHKEQSIWAIAVYRFGRRVHQQPWGLRGRLLDRLHWLLFRLTETATGISIPKNVDIGPGLRIYHFENVFICEDAKIGPNCTMRQGVTLGNRHEGRPSPCSRTTGATAVGAPARIVRGAAR